MAVRSVVTRYNYLLIDVNRVLNVPVIHRKSNVSVFTMFPYSEYVFFQS